MIALNARDRFHRDGFTVAKKFREGLFLCYAVGIPCHKIAPHWLKVEFRTSALQIGLAALKIRGFGVAALKQLLRILVPCIHNWQHLDASRRKRRVGNAKIDLILR